MSKYYSTRTECIDREIVEPIEASGIAKANEYDIDAIADKLVVMEPMDERHECSYRVDADEDEFWACVLDHMLSKKASREKFVSVDNGNMFLDASELAEADNGYWYDAGWDILVSFMDEDARNEANYELAPCTNIEFLTRYLELAPDDLVIG